MKLDADKQVVVLEDGREVSYINEKINRLNNCIILLNLIKEKGFVTSDIARDNGVRRCSARIWDLRHKYGYPIKTHKPTTKQDRLARYTL